MIDKVVCVELPTLAIDLAGRLRAIVGRSMVHKPYGDQNPSAPCMQSSGQGAPLRCVKRFPKPFADETQVPNDGYPIYRRRNDGQFVVRTVRGQEARLDNRFVVPYNPYLTRKYNAHINVEICAIVKAVKYIHKYIYKGSDKATVEIRGQNGLNEVEMHLQARYVSPAEAIVQLFEFPVHEEFPPVTRLPVHLEGQQPVYFGDNATADQLAGAAERARSHLMAFFDYNRDYTDGREVLYIDFLATYVYKQELKTWQPRQRGFSIGRMYFVPPTAGEKYYLRLLLASVPGPQSFEHLRTVNGIVFPSNREACLALGLLEDDGRWVSCFTDAAVWQTGHVLRSLFVTAILTGEVSNPAGLWALFAEQICDDLPYKLSCMERLPLGLENLHLDYGLFLINERLTEHEQDLQTYGLPAFWHNWADRRANHLLNHELAYDLDEQRAKYEESYGHFNDGQRTCFREFVDLAETDPSAAHFFIQGPGGTNKTFLYNRISAYFRA